LNKNTQYQEKKDVDNKKESTTDNSLKFNNDNNTNNGPKYKNNILFNSDNNIDKDTKKTANHDNSYNNN